MLNILNLKKTKPQPTEQEQILTELQTAWRNWVTARQNFKNAEPAFIDSSILALLAAEYKYNELLKKYKGLAG